MTYICISKLGHHLFIQCLGAYSTPNITWWRHQMETFSALLAICAGNSPVPGEFPAQRPVTRSFAVFFDLRLNKRLSKQSWGWWFKTFSRPLWRHCNDLKQWWVIVGNRFETEAFSLMKINSDKSSAKWRYFVSASTAQKPCMPWTLLKKIHRLFMKMVYHQFRSLTWKCKISSAYIGSWCQGWKLIFKVHSYFPKSFQNLIIRPLFQAFDHHLEVPYPVLHYIAKINILFLS